MWSNITLVTMLANVSNDKEEELLLVQKQCHFPLSPERCERLSGILLLQRQRRLACAWITAFSVVPMSSSWAPLSLQISVLWSLKKLRLYGFRHSLCRCSPFPVREGSFMLYQSSQSPLGIHLDRFCFLRWLKALSKSSRQPRTLLLALQKSPVGWKNFRSQMLDVYFVLGMLQRALVGSLLVMGTEGWVLRIQNSQWGKIKILLDLCWCPSSYFILLQLRIYPRVWGFSSWLRHWTEKKNLLPFV